MRNQDNPSDHEKLVDRSADFAGFNGVTYLNCAYHGPMPRAAARAAHAAVRLKEAPHRILDEYHFTFPDAYREAVARLIGCASRDVAVADSTTHGIMTLVGGLDWQPGDEVVVPEGEFPANLFPWHSLERQGVVLRRVKLERTAAGGVLSPQAVVEALSSRTRVVSVSWVSYVTGLRNDLVALGDVCRDNGVLFAVDGSQGIGGLPFDLRDTPCDLLACSGYKWMLGPYGLGFVYVNPQLAERLQPFNVNWFAIDGARDFNRLSRAKFAFEPHARRFDINETANFINIAAGTAALHYILDVTPAAVERHARALHERVLAGLPTGFRAVSDASDSTRSNILRVTGDSEAATRAAWESARARNVVSSLREGALRVSPHVYNTPDDIDRLLDAIAARPARHVVAADLPRGESVPEAAPGAVFAPEWSPRELRGTWFSLRPLDPDGDAGALFGVSHGDAKREAVWTYMPYGPFASPEHMADWLQSCAASRDPAWLCVVEQATGRRAGLVSFLNLEATHRTLEIGHIWYGPEFQYTEANSEAAYLMLQEAFEQLGCRRVEWKCDALNVRSRRAADRLGFAFEGIFRQHRVVKGRNRDTAWYAMLDADWPDAKARLSAWLHADPRTPLTTAHAGPAREDHALLRRLGCIPE